MIEFVCKDPVIWQYVDARFRRQFENELATKHTAAGREQLERVWKRRLTKEAAKQEWFDYVEIDADRKDWQGNVIGKTRKLVRDARGDPVLLVPEVVIGNE